MKRLLFAIVFPAVLAMTPSALTARQTGTVTGTVLESATGRPLAGVQVQVTGTALSVASRRDGRFLIPNVPAGEVQLRAQFIGHGAIEHTVQVVAGQTITVELRLTAQAIELREVVVTGTAGETERRAMGTVIASIDAAGIAERSHVTSLDQILQNRVPGMTIYPPQGAHGIGQVMQLRGLTSISMNSEPMIFVDGVRIDGSHDQGGVWLGGQHTSRLQDLAPQDIERVEIVKGAAAATLFGTQGSNGVIQIFTKRGSAGEPSWTMEIGQGYERIRTDTFPGRLFTQFHGPPDPETGEVFWAQDPIQEVTRGHHQRYNLSVAGGGESLRYFVSGNFRRAETSIRPETNWERSFAGRGNVDALVSETMTLSFSSSLSNTTARIPRGENAWESIYPSFAAGIPYTATARRPYGEPGGNIDAHATMEHLQDTRRATSGLTLDHRPWERFRHRATIGIDWYTEETTTLFPFGYEGQFYPLGNKFNHTRQFRDITTDYRATFTQDLSPEVRIRLSAGAQGNFTQQTRVEAYGDQFPGPGLSTVSAAAITSAWESRVDRVNAGVFVDQTLELWDRLFVGAGLRLDGNSAFGNEFHYQAYPKASVAYNISDEAFWPSRIFPTMKLRTAWGAAGKAPAQFAADRTYGPISAKDGTPGVTPSNIGNPNLGPERSQEFEIGFDAGILDNRVGLEFTIWKQRTKDALLSMPFPPSQGFLASQQTNLGEIRNDGVEFMISALLVRRPALEWDVNFQVAHQTSEVVDLGGRPPFSVRNTRIEEGYPVNGVWTWTVEWDPETRTHIYSDERVYMGPADPPWSGGLNSTIRLNRFTLGGTVGYAFGHRRVNFQQWWDTYSGTGDLYLSLVEKPTGATTAASDSLWDYAVNGGSYIFNYDADFIRIRELTVGYEIPPDLVSRFGMRRANLSFSARNVWHWTKWPGMDPEVGYYGSSTVGRGLDWNSTPAPRVFMLTFRTSF